MISREEITIIVLDAIAMGMGIAIVVLSFLEPASEELPFLAGLGIAAVGLGGIMKSAEKRKHS